MCWIGQNSNLSKINTTGRVVLQFDSYIWIRRFRICKVDIIFMDKENFLIFLCLICLFGPLIRQVDILTPWISNLFAYMKFTLCQTIYTSFCTVFIFIKQIFLNYNFFLHNRINSFFYTNQFIFGIKLKFFKNFFNFKMQKHIIGCLFRNFKIE